MSNAIMSGLVYKGVLAGTSPLAVSMANAPIPATAWLHSAASTGRKIEVSTDNGATYEEVTYELNEIGRASCRERV